MQKFDISIELTEPMLGTVPKSKEIYEKFIESKKPTSIEDVEVVSVEELEEKGWTGFHKDDNGLFIYDYMVKGFIKYAGNVLKDELGIKNLKAKLTDYIFVFPRRIYLGKAEPDGVFERPLRAMTMQGPRVTLARSEYVAAGTKLSFQIGLLKHKELTIEKIMTIMDYGQLQGLGQFRNGGFGRFVVDGRQSIAEAA
jgi:hypothetical protein